VFLYTTLDFLSLSFFAFHADVTRSNRHGTHGFELSRRREEVGVVVEIALDPRLGHRGVTPDEARRGLALGSKVDVRRLGGERVEITVVHHSCCLKHSNNFFLVVSSKGGWTPQV